MQVTGQITKRQYAVATSNRENPKKKKRNNDIYELRSKVKLANCNKVNAFNCKNFEMVITIITK